METGSQTPAWKQNVQLQIWILFNNESVRQPFGFRSTKAGQHLIYYRCWKQEQTQEVLLCRRNQAGTSVSVATALLFPRGRPRTPSAARRRRPSGASTHVLLILIHSAKRPSLAFRHPRLIPNLHKLWRLPFVASPSRDSVMSAAEFKMSTADLDKTKRDINA